MTCIGAPVFSLKSSVTSWNDADELHSWFSGSPWLGDELGTG
jgi:hypothetical protein